MKTIYFIRHSKPGKYSFIYSKSNLQIKNEKRKITKEGKLLAEKIFNNKEFDDVEEIYSSRYIRAYQTANILAKRLHLKVIVDSGFDERKIGIKTWDEYPEDFEEHQFKDNDFKIGDGESLNEVRKREIESLNKILTESKSNKIVIVFHSTAMMTLLKKWCTVNYNSNYYFNNKVFFDGKWDYCETFKLVFDDKELISIENI